MATGGDTKNRKCFMLPISSITLTVSEGDILETSANCIATGEDQGVEGRGRVSQLLLKKCPSSYKKAREEMKKRHSNKFDFCKVYPCNFHVAKDKKPAFNTVLHAIVPPAKTVTNPKEWEKQMKHLYYNLFKKANAEGQVSFALPVLGSGGAGASADVATDVLAHALTTFRHDNKGSHHILQDITVYARKETFGKLVTKVKEKLQSPQLLNGLAAQPCAGSRPGGVDSRRTTGSNQTGSRVNSAKSRGSGSKTSTTTGTKGGTLNKTSKSSASVSTASQFEEDSNLSLILGDMTLNDSQGVLGNVQERTEEEMECDDTVNIEGSEGEGNGEDKGDDDEEEEADRCAICLDELDNPKKLDKCGHVFCTECIEDSFRHHKPACPTCNTMYGMITGNQPKGTMQMSRHGQGLAGYQNCGMIIINYEFPSGTQGPEHPNPGHFYHGTQRRAFLPDSEEGRKVYRLLCVAFDNRLTFTVGRSRTTGADNVVTWNDIHHKTNPEGGPTHFGYPDPHYLSRVQEELAAKGVTEKCLVGRNFDL